jgi:hypothetical protein
MTRSFKKAFTTVSKKMADNAHSIVRRRVKEELKKEEPDVLIIEADTKEMGLEDYGTVFGLEFDVDADDEEWQEDKIAMRRK